jgi:hypothetical protein
MKPKFHMIFVVLVLMAMAAGSSPAGAATAAPTADAARVAAPLSMSSSLAPFLCSLNVSKTSKPAADPVGQPEPLLKTALPCGICSDYVCQTRSVGTTCPNLNGGVVPWHCYDISGTCPEDGYVKCSCVKNVP